MNIVEQIFKEKGLKRYGIILYSKNDALDFVKECKKHKIGILGIDGFFITETTTQPSMEDSIDFSSNHSERNIYDYDKAITFIEDRNANIYFEIVCE